MTLATSPQLAESESMISRLKTGDFVPLENVKSSVDSILKAATILIDHPKHHEFFYEIRPILTVASYLCASSIKYFPRAYEHDGQIRLTDDDVIIVECTRAVDGHQEAVRMEHLRRYGHAPAIQPIEAEGTKHQRKIPEQWSSFIGRDANLSTLSTNLSEAFAHKNGKCKDDSEINLLVTFDDWRIPITSEKQQFLAYIQRFWEQEESECNFSRVFVVGDSQTFVWNSCRPEEIRLV